MKVSGLMLPFGLGGSIFCWMTTVVAGSPVWIFTPLTATTLTIPSNSSATVQYLVTNQSRKTHSLALKKIPAVLQTTVGSGICDNPFVLGYQQSCVLSLQIDGSLLQQSIKGGPVICQMGSGNTPNPNECYQPSPNDSLDITLSPTPGATTISTTFSNLALSVNCQVPSTDCPASNAALTGKPRLITITNDGVSKALNVTYTASSLPTGTTITPSQCDIASGDSCVFTITPGAQPSAEPGVLNPAPISVSFAGTNTNTVTGNVNILTYGSVYESGYVFAVDDTTSNTSSIAGKVVAMEDVAGVIEWQPGCDDSLGTCTATNANNDGNGVQNTLDIVTALSTSYSANQYAGGVCNDYSINGYSGWYLPARCEMSYGDSGSSPCGTAESPTMQNIESNLVDHGIGYLNKDHWYWSSTQVSGASLAQAIYIIFLLEGFQAGDYKNNYFYVRCARVF